MKAIELLFAEFLPLYSLTELIKCGGILCCIGLTLLLPPFSYLMFPNYQLAHRRDLISRVEFDHEYFGAI